MFWGSMVVIILNIVDNQKILLVTVVAQVVPVKPLLQEHCPVESQVVPEAPVASHPQAKYNIIMFDNELKRLFIGNIGKLTYLDKCYLNYSRSLHIDCM